MTKSDDLLLAAAQRLIAKGGPAPTFAEITSEAGFSPKSKGAVYRRFARLRGSYVDWDDQIQRSFRILGQNVVQSAVPASTLPINTPRDILETIRLLATGLWKLRSHEENSSSAFPDAMRRGLSKLALMALEGGKRPPEDMAEASALFRSPFREWPIAQIPPELDSDATLLDAAEPTALCTELVISGGLDAEAELMEETMVRIIQRCQLYELSDEYSLLRKFLIERPVVERKELVAFRLMLHSELGALLDEIYEPIPPESLWEGTLRLCGYCGWTLRHNSEGTFQCVGSVCEGRGREGLRVNVAREQLPNFQRVNRGIRRFVVGPGRAEVDLARKLKDLGALVELWPAIDAYDLRVTFPTSQVWALDLKDWENPYLLANYIDCRGPFPEAPRWDLAFYVFPDHRSRMRPRYGAAFGSAWHGRTDRVSYAMERGILQAAKRELIGSENGCE